MMNITERSKMATKLEHNIEVLGEEVVREFYRVIVTEPRPIIGTHTYDHIIWIGEAKPEKLNYLKRKARENGASFRDVKVEVKRYDWSPELD
jgi:hypothetical protein